MYRNKTPKQQNALIYGQRLRCIGGVQSLSHHSYRVEAFTQDEINAIQKICSDAKERARTSFEETKRKLDSDPNACSGPETESRQYNGK